MLKELWIMRHGLANNHYENDFDRALSAEGEVQAKSAAEQLLLDIKQRQGDLPQTMLVSPFRRTQETAKVVHQVLNFPSNFETEDLLIHSADPKVLGDYLLASDFESVLLISHMPLVARLCQYFLPSTNILGFQTAQVVKINFDHSQQASLEKEELS